MFGRQPVNLHGLVVALARRNVSLHLARPLRHALRLGCCAAGPTAWLISRGLGDQQKERARERQTVAAP
eukprot:11220245-Lingulodinium_polyedra.AAC.1